jgi:hypothetical protein
MPDLLPEVLATHFRASAMSKLTASLPTPSSANFNGAHPFVVALEGKGPKDLLDRPYAGRRMSAVDQGYRYAINLPCDWIMVTSTRQTRLYHKGSDQHTYERFDTYHLFDDEPTLRPHDRSSGRGVESR